MEDHSTSELSGRDSDLSVSNDAQDSSEDGGKQHLEETDAVDDICNGGIGGDVESKEHRGSSVTPGGVKEEETVLDRDNNGSVVSSDGLMQHEKCGSEDHVAADIEQSEGEFAEANRPLTPEVRDDLIVSLAHSGGDERDDVEEDDERVVSLPDDIMGKLGGDQEEDVPNFEASFRFPASEVDDDDIPLIVYRKLHEASQETWATLPKDSIVVEDKQRPSDMRDAEFPDVDINLLDPNVQESFRLFRGQWKYVRRRYSEFQKWVCREHDVCKCPLLQVVVPSYQWYNGKEQSLCERRNIPPYPLKAPMRIILTCHSLNFDIGRIEPLFCGVSLYDTKWQKKLSENFYFHLNDGKVMSYIAESSAQSSQGMDACPRALFSVSDPHPGVYLIVWIEKVLQGSIDSTVKAYANSKMERENVKVMETRAVEFCRYNGEYRQPFLWGFVPLFKTDVDTPSLIDGVRQLRKFYSVENMPMNEIMMYVGETEYVLEENFRGVQGSFVVGLTNVQAKFLDYMIDDSRESEVKFEDSAVSVREEESESLDDGNSFAEDEIAARDSMWSEYVGPSVAHTHKRSVVAAELAEESVVTLEAEDDIVESDKHDIPSPDQDSSESEDSKNGDSYLASSRMRGDSADAVLKKYLFEETLQRSFRIIHEFPTSPSKSPYFTYMHDLYVTPIRVMLNSVKIRSSNVKNVLVRVYFRDNDDVEEQQDEEKKSKGRKERQIDGLPVLQLKSSARGYGKFADTQVSYNSKTPYFFDEIKVHLPLPPTRKHHVLFVFYNVNCDKDLDVLQGKKEDESRKLNVIGYSILASGDNYIIPDAEHSLPVFKDIAVGYLSNYVQQSLPVYEKGRPIFNVRSELRSTLYAQGEAVELFYSNAKPLLESMEQSAGRKSVLFIEAALDSACQSMSKLREADFAMLLPYLPVLNNLLFHVMCNVQNILEDMMTSKTGSIAPTSKEVTLAMSYRGNGMLDGVSQGSAREMRHRSSIFDRTRSIDGSASAKLSRMESKIEKALYLVWQVQKTAFLTTLTLIKGAASVLDETGRANVLLSSYVQYVFNNGHRVDRPVFFVLCDQWLKLLLKSGICDAVSPSMKSPNSLDSSLVSGDDDQSEHLKELMEFSWFFFDVIVKSLALYKNYVENPDEELILRFLGNVKVLCTHIIESMFRRSTEEEEEEKTVEGLRKVNLHVALFIRDLFHLFDESFALDLIRAYSAHAEDAETMNENAMWPFLLDFVDILADDEYFVAYCVGQCQSAEEPPSVLRRSFLASLVANTVYRCTISPSVGDELRLKCIQMFLEHLCKIEYDARFRECERKSAVAVLYFRYIQLSVHKDVFDDMKSDLLEEHMLCMMWMFENLSREVFREWWHSLTIKQLNAFLGTMMKCVMFVDSRRKERRVVVRRKVASLLLEVFVAFLEELLSGPLEGGSEWSALGSMLRDIVQNCASFLLQLSQAFVIDTSSAMSQFEKDVMRNSVEDIFMRRGVLRAIELLGSLLSSSKQSKPWHYLVAACLLHTSFPTPRQEKPITVVCLDMLLDQFPAGESYVSGEGEEEQMNVFVMDEGTTIKAATEDKLIESLTFHSSQDPMFRQVFFLTYRSFTSSSVLLRKLIYRFDRESQAEDADSKDGGAPKDPTRLLVCNAFKHWVDKFFYDFDNEMLATLLRFLDGEVARKYSSNAARQLKRALEKKLVGVKEEFSLVFARDPPKSLLPKGFNRDSSLLYVPFSLLDWPPLEVARQMTLMEHRMFCDIVPKECLGGAFMKKDKDIRAPNIMRMIHHFNRMSRWVVMTILGGEDARKRRDIMKKFVDIAESARQLNNFNAVNEITSGLNNSAIFRLKASWELLPSNVKSKFEDLHKIVAHPYYQLREALRSSNPPCVPYAGMYFTDLTFIEEGNKDSITENDLINFGKRRQIARVIIEMRTYQQTPYHFEEIDYLQDYLLGLRPPNDEDLFNVSLVRERRKKKGSVLR